MHYPTLLNLANYGRALIRDDMKVPCISICNEYFFTEQSEKCGNHIVMFIRACVPGFHHHILSAHLHWVSKHGNMNLFPDKP